MKTRKIKTKSTGKAVAKVAGLLFCTSLFGLTLAAPSKAQQFVLGDSSTSSHIMYLSSGGYRISRVRSGAINRNYWAWISYPGTSKNYWAVPEPLTTLGSVMGAGGLVWLKKRRSEKDKLA
ncbi:MAG TPA: PEP-CTERM sorting domain-containing protein [Oscillatoriaceae cyanobacterium M33_DOE_052]|uniref:PEP-CTERM sorting domain-containing protein n=1 Tax=Planktothricoides sp. SpSt-374 TaxID=2282167 RepID=A0A7C3ZKV3_9CYAN|nr:PEP-CTERM sorting domain-containing protein [Oscillatoriaceae cyanobacterium M33_DOE_052]